MSSVFHVFLSSEISTLYSLTLAPPSFFGGDQERVTVSAFMLEKLTGPGLPGASEISVKVEEGRKEMFYLTTHSTHFIYGYMASDIW